jgi:hypothetical protein
MGCSPQRLLYYADVGIIPATTQKVAGSIPDEVMGFFSSHNISSWGEYSL